MTLKDGYGFGGFSGTPPSEPNLSTPPPPGYVQEILTKHEQTVSHHAVSRRAQWYCSELCSYTLYLYHAATCLHVRGEGGWREKPRLNRTRILWIQVLYLSQLSQVSEIYNHSNIPWPPWERVTWRIARAPPYPTAELWLISEKCLHIT